MLPVEEIRARAINIVVVIILMMWHGTEKIAHAIAEEIHRVSPDTIVKVFNVDHTEKDDILYEVFKSKAIAVGSPTILNGILASMASFLYYLKSLKLKGKKAAVFGCYGWSGEGCKVLREMLTEAGFKVVSDEVKSSWNPEEGDYAKVPALVGSLLDLSEVDTQNTEKNSASFSKWQCPCGYVYDPEKGDPDHGVRPGTVWEDVPADWVCPVCGLPKSAFKKIEE